MTGWAEVIPLPPSLTHKQTHKGDCVSIGAVAREEFQ